MVSLFTHVPVKEAIRDCADLMYNGNNEKPPVSKTTFIKLAELSVCDVIMATHRGNFIQKDGLAMGSSPPHYSPMDGCPSSRRP